MKFTESHEWVDLVNGSNIATVGVSNYAQKELGEIVYVELPRIGAEVVAGREAAVLESTKAAADVYSPVSGTIVEVNERLKKESDLVNRSPEQEGWIFRIKLKNPSEVEALIDSTKYRQQFN